MSHPVPVTMYTQALCGYCSAARDLLRAKQVEFTEIDVTLDPDKRKEMIERTGRTTVPQIYIGDTHIGGYDDMAALEREEKLDPMLAGEQA